MKSVWPSLFMAFLVWISGLAQADTAPRPSFIVSNYTKTAFGE